MTPGDAAELLAMCSAYDNRKPTEIAARAWSAALPDINLSDARAAIITYYSTHRDWVMPADVRLEVKATRRARHADAETKGALLLAPPESIDSGRPELGQAWQRAFHAAIGDGHDVAGADQIACQAVGATRAQIGSARPVEQVVDQVSRAMPRIPRAR
ncbi:MAG: hypothetical protein ACOH2F_03550 [Cellulomonas sp.]